VLSVTKVIICVLGAGLPRELVAGRIGEAEDLADAARSAGRKVPAWETFFLAADNVLADRWAERASAHLPTLAGPGAVLAAAGTAMVGIVAGHADADDLKAYTVQSVSVGLLALTLAFTRRYPHRAMAIVVFPLSGSMLCPLPRSTALDWASYRHGTVVLLTDYLGATAMLATAVLLPLALVPLAFRRHPINWADLPRAIQSSIPSRWAWPALSIALVVLAPTTLVNGLVDPAIPVGVRTGMALNAAGMALGAIGIRHTVRAMALCAPTGTAPVRANGKQL
jgi:hypothetical protein